MRSQRIINWLNLYFAEKNPHVVKDIIKFKDNFNELENLNKEIEENYIGKKNKPEVVNYSKSYSVDIVTFDDEDYVQVIYDLLTCKGFEYIKYDIPKKITYEEFMSVPNYLKSFVKEWFNIGYINTKKKKINKLYFNFYF